MMKAGMHYGYFIMLVIVRTDPASQIESVYQRVCTPPVYDAWEYADSEAPLTTLKLCEGSNS